MENIKVENLYKVYGNGENKVEAVKDISFTIKQGEFVAIVGESGSGKSTLLHLIGGLDRPTSGKVFLNDDDIFSLSEKKLSIFRRRNLGFVFQFFNLVPMLNVYENIVLPILLDHKKPDKEYISELIETLGLSDRCKHSPSQLSGGQQQRVAIARALSYKPPVLLADEPTGNLDSKNSSEVIDLLKTVSKRYGQTVVIITHDRAIEAMADRVIRIEDGQVTI